MIGVDDLCNVGARRRPLQDRRRKLDLPDHVGNVVGDQAVALIAGANRLHSPASPR